MSLSFRLPTQNKLISSERLFKILQNVTQIIKIVSEKKRQKIKMMFLEVLHKLENNKLTM